MASNAAFAAADVVASRSGDTANDGSLTVVSTRTTLMPALAAAFERRLHGGDVGRRHEDRVRLRGDDGVDDAASAGSGRTSPDPGW